MLMDDNDIDENDSDGNVSVHSIVTDKEDFDSDNESPQDQQNQTDKIKDNHVVKRINVPGRGVDKPSKHDFLQINYSCYFIGQEMRPIISNRHIDHYLYKIILPYGIIKALKCMRKGERSFITLEPKYGFRKVPAEKLGRYIELDQVSQEVMKDFENEEAFLKKLAITSLVYDVELVFFEKIYCLTDKRNMMKRIIANGAGITRPSSDSLVFFSINIYNNDECLFANERIECVLSSSLLTECDRIILQSMKKKEKCQVDILNSYFNESIHTADGIVNQALKGKHIEGRIKYEVELFKFSNNTSSIECKGHQYRRTIISKGIGNISPWKDSLVMLACQLTVNNEEVYSDIQKAKYASFEAFRDYIKGIKKEIKERPNYDKNTQFIINEFFNEASFPIYDELHMNLPFVFRKEIIQGMKPLTILSIEFSIENTAKAIEENYFHLGDYDLASVMSNGSKALAITLNICLINFEENVSVFNNKLISNKAEKIGEYKAIANDFYSKGFIRTAKKINKKLSDGYIMALNLGNKIQMNDEEAVTEKKDSETFGKEAQNNMRKVMSNLILILMKMDQQQLCEKYIAEYLQIFGNDEKVLYHKLKLLRKKGEYEKAIECLDMLIKVTSKDQYKLEKEEVKAIIEQNKAKHVTMLKKMMKSI